MKNVGLVRELAARAKVDEKTAEQTLQALGLDSRFEAVAASLGKELKLKDIRLGIRLAHGQVAV